MSWVDGPLVAFDVETTGVDYETDRIVTAAISMIPGAENDDRTPTHANWLIDPGVEIAQGATEVHGISTEHARAHGRPAADAIAEIVDALAHRIAAGAAVVAFNARFDLTMLDREARRYGIKALADRGLRLRVIDPFVIDKASDRFRRGKRTLVVVCGVYDVTLEDAHAADADAMAAARLAWRMGRRLPAIGTLELDELHDLQVEWAAEQAASLEEYFRRQGRDETCERQWPLVDVPDVAVGGAA